MKVLIIKTSSMGDVIHTLPALTDAITHNKNIQFDWVVEEGFSEIPAWHPAVNQVIPVAIRRWRKALLTSWPECRAALKAIRATDYDLIIDAQGLFKSAVITHLAHGTRKHGLNKTSSREKRIQWAYDHTHNVPFGPHAVERVRKLFAKALNYPTPTSAPDYGIRKQFKAAKPATPYVVFLVNTTWKTKQYPQAYWKQLVALAIDNGFEVKLTSGNDTELAYAKAITKGHKNAEALKRLSIQKVATLLRNAAGVIAVDTGFAHLAAALHTPCVGLYGPTNPDLSANYGPNQLQLKSDIACAPCLQKRCTHKDKDQDISPPCFVKITPEKAWIHLKTII
jgi:heptosyltransferase-1